MMNSIVKRFFDIFLSSLILLITSPLLVLISVVILFDSKGGVFYKQIRIGKNQRPFILYKFRTMERDVINLSLVTLKNDSRITMAGRFLRKFKIDELPQLFNVIKGDMSLVGPRPEVPRWVEKYNDEQKRILNFKPGITSYASIIYRNENELLSRQKDPEKYYIEKILPHKIKLDLKYSEHSNLCKDIKIIWRTIKKVIFD